VNSALDLRSPGGAEAAGPAQPGTPSAGGAGTGAEAGGSAAAPSAASAGGSAPAGSGGSVAASATPGAGGGAVRTTPGATTGPAGAQPGAAPQAAPSTTPLLIGAYGLSAAGGAVGISGAALGDPVAFSEAVAKWVNSHGGVAGHPIKLVQAATDPTSSTPVDQQDQAACAKFTEDNHVAAVVSIVTTTPTFDDCMSKRGILYIPNSITQPDTSYAEAGNNRFSSSPTADRMAVTLADELGRNGYLKDAGIKLGIASQDYPWFRSASSAFKAELARIGGPPVSAEFYGCSGCSSDQAKQEATNAALRFRSAGITHVVLPDGSTAGNTFLGQANQSGYFPRLGLTSSNLLSLIALNVPNPAGLRGAVAIGFMPTLDTDGNPSHGAPPQTAREKVCDDIMTSSPGTQRNNRLAEEQAQFTCDGFFFLKEIGDRQHAIDLPTFRAGVETTGNGFTPVLTFHDFFGPGRHDGTQTYRPAAFNDGCTCFVYTGGELNFSPLPGRAR
jgi:ABC-type branched-subunit amino acid transport system substrate-binding protein